MTEKDAVLIRKTEAALSRRYLSALRAHLGERRPANGDRPQGLGRAALAGGLAMRDLALMHDKALIALAFWHAGAHRDDRRQPRHHLESQ